MRASSSHSSVAKKLSAIALSKQSPTETHRQRHVPFPASGAEGQRRVLAALVGMMDDTIRPALRYGHLQRLDHQLRAQVRRYRPADDPPAGLRLPGDSSINTGMECGGNVESPSDDEVPLVDVASHAGCRRGCTVTQPQQEAGHGVRAAAYHFQTGPGYGGQGLPVCGAQLPFEHPAQTAGGRASGQRLGISPGAAVSRQARSRVNAVVPARPLTRAAAEARIRRGRWARGRATSWRTGRAGRVCVGARCVRRWRGPAGCRRPCGCGCRRTPCG